MCDCELESQEWYQRMIEDCRAIIVETEFTARWTIIEGYHSLGMRILKETENLQRSRIYGNEIVQRVAQSLRKSPRTIWYAIQFARSFPELNLLPEGKDVSWRKICQKYLPENNTNEETENRIIVEFRVNNEVYKVVSDALKDFRKHGRFCIPKEQTIEVLNFMLNLYKKEVQNEICF